VASIQQFLFLENRHILQDELFFLNVNHKFVNQYTNQSGPEVTVHVKKIGFISGSQISFKLNLLAKTNMFIILYILASFYNCYGKKMSITDSIDNLPQVMQHVTKKKSTCSKNSIFFQYNLE